MRLKVRRLAAAGEMVAATLIWGFGFIAAVWALREIDPFVLTFLRFALGSLALIPFLFDARSRADFARAFPRAFPTAALLTGFLILQTWGQKFTTATKSGFITTLYVVLVPLLEARFGGRRVSRFLWACVFTAVFGTALIVDIGLDTLNFGDGLTAVAAVVAAFQILLVGRVSRGVTRPFLFNCAQSVWGAVVSLPVALVAGRWDSLTRVQGWAWTTTAGLLWLGFLSTIIAFALQLRAQARLTPTVASVLFLLESPFAMGFAIVLLGEHLNLHEALGAVLIFLAAGAAVLR